MVTHRDEEVEEELPSPLHLHLHRTAALEGRPATDYQGEVVRTELGVGIRSIGVGVSSAREDGAALDARLEALLAEGQTFELVETVLFCSTAFFFFKKKRKIISNETNT